MLPIALILLAIVFTALMIFYLHQNHLKKTLEIAENTNALAPLELELNTVEPPMPKEELTVVEEIGKAQQKSQSWSDEIKSLRDSGCFPEALALSKRQYPKLLAYRQTLITLRARFKQEPTYLDELLSDLYQTAVLGDLVKSTKSDQANIGNIKTELGKPGGPQQYWNTLGYHELDLLTKTDCKLLVKHWGEPENHCAVGSLLNIQGKQ